MLNQNMENLWILIVVAALIIIFAVVFFVRKDKNKQRLSPLASLSLFLVLAGIIFGDSRIVGYSLIGTGIALAVIDIILKSKGGNNGKRKKKL